jgi:hypothetical protein
LLTYLLPNWVIERKNKSKFTRNLLARASFYSDNLFHFLSVDRKWINSTTFPFLIKASFSVSNFAGTFMRNYAVIAIYAVSLALRTLARVTGGGQGIDSLNKIDMTNLHRSRAMEWTNRCEGFLSTDNN